MQVQVQVQYFRVVQVGGGQVQVLVHKFPCALELCRWVQVQMQVHRFSLCSRVVQVGVVQVQVQVQVHGVSLGWRCMCTHFPCAIEWCR